MKKGGIAQLVERLLCKQDVSGSNPLTSTKKNSQDSAPSRKEVRMLKINFSLNLENCIKNEKKVSQI